VYGTFLSTFFFENIVKKLSFHRIALKLASGAGFRARAESSDIAASLFRIAEARLS
jgi:hypothetical protein